MSTRNRHKAERRSEREQRKGDFDERYNVATLIQALCVIFSGKALATIRNRAARRGNATHGSLKRWVP